MQKILRVFYGLSVLWLTGFSARGYIGTNFQMQLGNPSGATSNTSNTNHYLIVRTVEAMDYDANFREPNWVSWDLTAGDVGSSGRSGSFFQDTSLPAGFYEVTPDDYSGSGFDRGHMCPSADRTDNTTDNDMVFLMSNIIPQAPNNNQGVWASFEDYCRTLAQSGNELLITCGPSLFNGTRTASSGSVAIPTYTWKIAVVVPGGTNSAVQRIDTTTRVIALKIPNSNSVSSSWQTYVTSASQIEADTGFTFFTALSPSVAAALRSKVDGQSGSAPVISGFSPASGMAGDTVVITGTNFSSVQSVSFSGVNAAYNVDSVTQITAQVPTNANSGPISVSTASGVAVSANNFTVLNAPQADLTISVTHSGNFTQGDAADTYTLIVTNLGNLATSGLITVTNALPAGLTATSIAGSGWTTDLPTLTCSRSDALAAGAAYPAIVVTVSVATNAPPLVTNVVMVSGGGETNLVNDAANDVTVINSSSQMPVTGVLAGWDVNALTGFGPTPFAATTNAANVTVTGLTRGAGVGTSGTAAQRAWGGTGFADATESAATANNHFATFTITANSGYNISFSAVNPFNYRRSSSAGPPNGALQYQVGGGTFADVTSFGYGSSSSGGTLGPIDLSGVAALQNVPAGTTVTFRIVNWGGGSGGTWYIYDVTNSTALDLAIQGTVTPALTPIQSWRQQWFGTIANSGAAADTAIASSDGMPNLLKYAFGLNPLTPAANPIVSDIATGHLRLTLPKNPNATDVSFFVELTGSLPSASWSTNGTVVDQNTATLLQVHDGQSITNSSSGFMRLRVSRP